MHDKVPKTSEVNEKLVVKLFYIQNILNNVKRKNEMMRKIS